MDVEEIENFDPGAAGDDVFQVTEEKTPKIDFWYDLNREVFRPGDTCTGCGPQTGIKLALQMFGESVIVCSEKCVPDMAKDLTVIVSENPLVAASVLSEEKQVICFADDETLSKALCSFKPKGNFLCVCWNNSKSLWKTFYSKNIPYVATASLGYIEDYMSKLKKAKNMKGVRFIDLYAPCLMKKEFNCSDTALLARTATVTGVWPVFEVMNNEFLLTQRPELESLERFYAIQKTKIDPEKMELIKRKAERNWSLLNKKKFWMID